MKFYLWGLVAVLLAILAGPAIAAPLLVGPGEYDRAVGLDLEYLEDKTGQLTLDQVRQPAFDARFRPVAHPIANFNFTQSSYWVRFRIDWARPDHGHYYLWQEYPLTDFLTFYRPDGHGGYERVSTGDQFVFAHRELPTRAFGIRLPAHPGTTDTVYIELHGAGTLVVDLHLSSGARSVANSETRHLIFGLFYGALLVMLLYNLVLFLSLRDPLYAYYVVYVSGLGLSFFDVNGLAFRYLWPDWTRMNTDFLVFVFISLFGLSQFSWRFLGLRRQIPVLDKLLLLYSVACFVCIALVFVLPDRRLFPLSQMVALALAPMIFGAGAYLWLRGYRPARYYVLACTWYLAGLVLYPLQNFGLIPTSTLSNYSVQIGSCFEMVLLSLALADRINDIKREKVLIEQKARRELEEANAQLEQRVHERTNDLFDTLKALRGKHEALVNTQEQLVQAEKMSSLGGLVAGVAHEINNPANFTKLSAENLARNVGRMRSFLLSLADEDSDPALLEDLQQQFTRITQDLELINDGTRRLATVVGDLRRFSRLDEAEAKVAAPDEGLEATLNLVRAQYRDRVHIELHAASRDAIGLCYPAALNQVFMNMAVNACQAILEKARLGLAGPDAEGLLGRLRVSSGVIEKDGLPHWQVCFEDDGIGMDAATRLRIFEPFFTTRSVGEGTGLGLSISYGIIQRHAGQIQVESTPGRGSRFTLVLPLSSTPVAVADKTTIAQLEVGNGAV